MQDGYENISDVIQQVFNGHEAIEIVKDAFEQDYSFGLIFMDCSMPVVDGY